MMVSDAVLEAMGFRRLSKSETICANFHYLHVFEVRGFTLTEEALPIRAGSIAGKPYQLGVGSSVNAICQALVHVDFADSEQEWATEKKCTSPYVVVHLGPTIGHRFAGTHAILDAADVLTYRGFNAARVELQLWSDEVLPAILAGLASSFARNEQPVKLQPVDDSFVGFTEDRRTVHDMRIMGSCTAYASVPLTTGQVESYLESAERVASNVKQKVAKFLYLARQEDDALERFLYSFLAIEIETHATFKEIDLDRMLLAGRNPPAFAAAIAQSLLNDPGHQFTSLGARFIWCVVCVWSHLSEADVDHFKRLKKIRDDIAHGSLAAPPSDAVTEVERLSAKLQLAAPSAL